MINEMVARAAQIIAAKNTKEAAARRISAEFPVAAFISKGKLWATYRNEKGMPVSQMLM